MTCQGVAEALTPFCGSPKTAFSQISSRPKTTRVGARVSASVAVGSASIHKLYQDCTPGPYPSASPTGPSALFVPGSWSCDQSMIFVQLRPKSFDTYAPSSTVGAPLPGAARQAPTSRPACTASGQPAWFAAYCTMA